MDDTDMALEALKVQIKKEIIDNYFALRCTLEEDTKALESEAAAYRQKLSHLSRLFHAFYAAIGQKAAIDNIMKLLSLPVPPYYDDFQQLSPAAREALLKEYRSWGLTAWGRHVNLVQNIYQKLAAKCHSLKEQYDQVTVHLRLLNEDIQKFNQSFDFGLIAAQIEALEGGGAPIGGGLLSGEREELSTRMRFKTKKFTEEELPPPPGLPSLEDVKGQFKEILKAFSS